MFDNAYCLSYQATNPETANLELILIGSTLFLFETKTQNIFLLYDKTKLQLLDHFQKKEKKS